MNAPINGNTESIFMISPIEVPKPSPVEANERCGNGCSAACGGCTSCSSSPSMVFGYTEECSGCAHTGCSGCGK